MSHRIIATRTDSAFGLVEEQEFISTDDALKVVFLEFGWAKPYDPTKPLPPKGSNDYEPGFAYPQDRYVLHNGSLYKSNPSPALLTSTTWVPGEWVLKIQGVI